MIKRLLYTLLILSFATLGWATTYYVKNGGSDGNTGLSDAQAWETIAKVNSFSFSAGDDVYFKCDDTWTPSNPLGIDWDGVDENNRSIIGAYYGSGTLGVSGTRPIISGNNFTEPDNTNGMVHAADADYLHIKNLYITESNGAGISIFTGSYNIIENNYTYQTVYQGIMVARSSHNLVYDNEVIEASYGRFRGASIEITGTGSGSTTSTEYNTIYRNEIHGGYEGIGIYQYASTNTIEYNTIYDNRSYQLYIADNTNDNIARYNLIYHSSGVDNKRGLVIGCENTVRCDSISVCATGNKAYGNLIANAEVGINLLNKCETHDTDLDLALDDNLIYNNTIVDCDANFMTNDLQSANASGNVIANNISRLYTAGTYHSKVDGSEADNPQGVTWNYNLFYGVDTVGANANTNYRTGNPNLYKTSGWRSLTAGNVTGEEFSTTSGGDGIDNGVSISGYNGRISAADFTATPITVTAETDATPDIGAWMYGGGEPPAVSGNLSGGARLSGGASINN